MKRYPIRTWDEIAFDLAPWPLQAAFSIVAIWALIKWAERQK